MRPVDPIWPPPGAAPASPPAAFRAQRHHRTLFLSDLHLGARGCRAADLLRFLELNSADTVYLVGDILDLWHPRRVHWAAAQDRILGLLSARAAAGHRIVYLTGNHDQALGSRPHGMAVARQAVHATADGRAFLVLHGDCCDARVLRWHICTRIGSRIDGALRDLDAGLRRFRRRHPTEGRSLIARLLAALNAALALGSGHERRLVALARQAGRDGVICGHFHKPALNSRHGLIYANCGDWMDSCTALAEDHHGRLHLLTAAPGPVTEAATPAALPLPGALSG
jgi:UDP-2,3-diacylglucosamine pyrophosphatase LpxH